eukprot:2525277-Amphidinium_carterae.1
MAGRVLNGQSIVAFDELSEYGAFCVARDRGSSRAQTFTLSSLLPKSQQSMRPWNQEAPPRYSQHLTTAMTN